MSLANKVTHIYGYECLSTVCVCLCSHLDMRCSTRGSSAVRYESEHRSPCWRHPAAPHTLHTESQTQLQCKTSRQTDQGPWCGRCWFSDTVYWHFGESAQNHVTKWSSTCCRYVKHTLNSKYYRIEEHCKAVCVSVYVWYLETLNVEKQSQCVDDHCSSFSKRLRATRT